MIPEKSCSYINLKSFKRKRHIYWKINTLTALLITKFEMFFFKYSNLESASIRVTIQ